ncbi:hypothetical protein [Anaerosalibacter massiliensis]|uniref:Uncharacterized protein n=1 Tax=Anaerosalibacter massiliensis TaxID=1347392 RepID=A0A9X2MJ22_9FIRM|nr:hypothetical protein [Anaerosalibacter massiliensis]MCR2044052.1 hypothetical protein [Anaerosalibacter massiliensis]
MKKQMKYFLLSFIIILLSTPLGYAAINIVYNNRNLTGEYTPILNGFIHSFMLIGVLIFCIGLIEVLINRDNKL